MNNAFEYDVFTAMTVINKDPTTYRCAINIFNKDNSLKSAYGWRNDESYTYALESDYKYRFVFSKIDNSSITVNEVNNNFEYIIGKYTEKTYKRIDMIDKIIKVQNQISKSAQFISIAHQGYHSIYANQTLDAYKAAAESTFNWVECDLKVTSDGVVICSHNETVYADETTMQINPVIGSANNVYNTAIEISSISYDDLCMYDIAKWKNEDLPSQTFPTLENVIKIAKYYNMGLVIDHLFALNRLNNWDVLKNLIQQYGMENKTALTSTSQYISENCPNVKYFSTCVESTYSSVLQSLINFKNTYGSDCYLNILKTVLTDEIKTTVRNNGIGLMVWTIDDLDEYKNYLTNYYLDGITSDYYSYYDIP